MENTTVGKLYIRRSRSDPPTRVQPAIINTTTMAKTKASQTAEMNAHAVPGVDDISSPTSDSNQTKVAVSKKKASTKKSTKSTKGTKSAPAKRNTRSSKSIQSIPSAKKAKLSDNANHSPTPVL